MNPKQLKIIFAGTPEFSAVALAALLESAHKIIAVYTQPDRPSGRGRKLTASPVKELAIKNHIPIYQPESLREEPEQKILSGLKADIMIVAAYGILLPPPILNSPALGCINIHTSLLPRWRGAAPIQRAILAGDTTTGITIIQMDAGLDTGAMLLKQECEILPTDTSATLHDRLAKLGAESILRVLEQISEGKTKPEIQDSRNASYAKKITKDEAKINWNETAKELQQKIRAFNPWPIAFTGAAENPIRIWQAAVIEAEVKNNLPGTILKVSPDGIDVATAENILRLQKLQLPGGKTLAVKDIINSRQQDFPVGKVLG